MKRKFALLAIFLIWLFPAISSGAQKIITDYNKTKTNPSYLNAISFDQHMPYFYFTPSTSGAVTVNTTDKTANLGNSVGDSCGVLWYGGTNPLVGNCVNGLCDFGTGFRAYFEFRFLTTDTSANSTDRGDGFTFAVINGTNNDGTRRGGPGSGSMGELMCYAGSGNTTDQYGLRSPKMAIEYDTYGNTGAMVSNGCSSGRADPNNLNHMALMFWGDNKTGNCGAGCTSCLQASYDDNVHGICTSGCTNPGPPNSTSGDGTGGYCQRTGGKVGSYNWMEDGQTHLARVEVTRATSAVGGTYAYNIKAWIDCEAVCITDGSSCTNCCSGTSCNSCTAYEINNFQNIFDQYYDSANPRPWSAPPKINRTVQLSAADHANFNKILFGFTEGTGGAVQNILISNFRIYFPGSLPCYYSINPTNASYPAGGSSGNTVAVTANTGCAWTAVSNNAWITITSGASGTGNGTVTYNVASTTSSTSRTGTMTIAGNTFMVTQAGCGAFTITPTSRTVPRAAGTGSIAVDMSGGCAWTAVSNNAWITITSGASGTGSGTINYSYTQYNGSTGTSRTGTITVTGPGGTQTFTLTQTRP
jgi:hypothetical protein